MTRNQLKEGVKDQEELRVSVQEKGKRDSLVKTIISKSKKKPGWKISRARKKEWIGRYGHCDEKERGKRRDMDNNNTKENKKGLPKAREESEGARGRK